MAREVAWTETALRDLERAAEYIAEDSPGYAASLVRQVRDRAASLGDLTQRGRIVPELDDPAVRELVVGNYRLIYEVGPRACLCARLDPRCSRPWDPLGP